MSSFQHSIEMRWSEEDECYVAIVPEFPGCISHGANPSEALTALMEAASLWIESTAAAKRKIPEPMTAEKLSAELEKAQDHVRGMIESAVRKVVEEEQGMTAIYGFHTRGSVRGFHGMHQRITARASMESYEGV